MHRNRLVNLNETMMSYGFTYIPGTGLSAARGARRRSWLLHHRCARGIMLSLLALVLGGCRSAPPSASSPAQPDQRVTTDASAERLHELSGQILAYYARHEQLPPSLEALAEEAGPGAPPAVSPGTGEPCVYHAPPLPLPRRSGLLLMHDPMPVVQRTAERSMRWAMVVQPKRRGAPLTAQVILLPASQVEAAMQARRAG